jgi:DNA-binding transcriptional MerR regulator
MQPNGKLRSGELAQLAGVSADTIRHYERIGILPKSPRTVSGYRLYSHDAAERVLLVRTALQLGFTLAELVEILQTRDHGGVPCHRVLSLMQGKLLSVKQQITELHRTERLMIKLVKEWKQKVASSEPGSRAMLLQNLSRTVPSRMKKVNPTTRRVSL